MYFHSDPAVFVLKVSLAQYAATFISFSNMAEVPVASLSKKVVHRHLSSELFPPVAYLSSVMLAHFPVAAVGDLFFSLAIYWWVKPPFTCF